jgi:hypothetical protein
MGPIAKIEAWSVHEMTMNQRVLNSGTVHFSTPSNAQQERLVSVNIPEASFTATQGDGVDDGMER